MGFTRYWKIKNRLDTEKFKEYSETCRVVCEAWEREQISKGDTTSGLAGWDGWGEPTFSDKEVCFNGCASDEDLAHETFSIDVTSKQFNFCKTARKPYDKQVAVCLYLAKKFFGDSIEVESDGNNEDEGVISFVKSFLREEKINFFL